MKKFILALSVITGCLHLLLHHAVLAFPDLLHYEHHHNHDGTVQVHPYPAPGNHPIGLSQVLRGRHTGLCSHIIHIACPVALRQVLHLDSAILGNGAPGIMNLPPEVTSEVLTAYIGCLLKEHKRLIYADIKLERELFNSKLIRVSDILVGTYNDEIRYLENKVDLLIEAVSNENKTLNCKVSETNLKIDTYNTYHEQIMYNLKHGLFDALSSIPKHEVIHHDQHSLHTNLPQAQLPPVLPGHAVHHHLPPVSADHSHHQVQLPLVLPGHVVQQHLPQTSVDDRHHHVLHAPVLPGHAAQHHLPQAYADDRHHQVQLPIVAPGHGVQNRLPLASAVDQHHQVQLQPVLPGHAVHHYLPQPSTDHHHHDQQVSAAPHLPPILFTCFKCDLNFEQFYDLNSHIEAYHQVDTIFPCDECQLSFKSLVELEAHVDSEHTQQHIPQYDGPVQEFHEFTDISPDTCIRTAGYSFNQDKQTEKIKNDAKLDDYEVTVNNSDQNATIKCSTGFYIQVARPCFVTLDKKSVITRGKIAITLDDLKLTLDQKGLEATRLIHFSFMSELKSLGGVTIHLHHSTRTIQVQGSHIMPDSTRSALWFVHNVILIRFKEQSKAKGFAIKNCNEAVLKISKSRPAEPKTVPNSTNACYFCKSVFNTQSKPSRCALCTNFFHKTSCLKDHMKSCNSSSTQSGAKNPTIPPLPNPLPVSDAPISATSGIPGLKTTMTFVPVSASSTTSAATTILHSGAICSSFNLASGSASGISSMPSLAAPNPSQTSFKAGGKKRQKPPFPTTDAEAKVEFLQTELNAAKARIVQLDASILDKDKRVSVLMARLKMFEDKHTKEVCEEYFPHENDHCSNLGQSSSEPARATCSSSTPHPTSCSASSAACSTPPRCSFHCPPPPCSSSCVHQCHCQHNHTANPESCSRKVRDETDLKDIIEKIDLVGKETTKIKTVIQDLITNKDRESKDYSATNTKPPNKPEEVPLQPDVGPSDSPDLNASIASIEEFIPEIPEHQTSSHHLNCHVPTNQLQ